MSGIEGIQDLSQAQLDAAAGGPVLRAEVQAVSSPQGGQAAARAKVIAKLKESLMAPGFGAAATPASQSGLLVPLLVLIAQARNMILFQFETRHLKLVGMLYDQTQETLRQYLEFLEAAATPQQYAALVPPLPQLALTYKIDPPAAFDIFRPVLRMVDHSTSADPRGVALAAGPHQRTWGQLLDDVRAMRPPEVWAQITPRLYLTFWSLSLQDLHTPKEAYAAAVERHRPAIDQLQRSSGLTQYAQSASKDRKELERIKGVIAKLDAECKQQEEHVLKVAARLRAECAEWFELGGLSAGGAGKAAAGAGGDTPAQGAAGDTPMQGAGEEGAEGKAQGESKGSLPFTMAMQMFLQARPPAFHATRATRDRRSALSTTTEAHPECPPLDPTPSAHAGVHHPASLRLPGGRPLLRPLRRQAHRPRHPGLRRLLHAAEALPRRPADALLLHRRRGGEPGVLPERDARARRQLAEEPQGGFVRVCVWRRRVGSGRGLEFFVVRECEAWSGGAHALPHRARSRTRRTA